MGKGGRERGRPGRRKGKNERRKRERKSGKEGLIVSERVLQRDGLEREEGDD